MIIEVGTTLRDDKMLTYHHDIMRSHHFDNEMKLCDATSHDDKSLFMMMMAYHIIPEEEILHRTLIY